MYANRSLFLELFIYALLLFLFDNSSDIKYYYTAFLLGSVYNN